MSWTSASPRCSSTSPARSSLADLQQRLRDLCRRASRRALDHRPRLEPGAVAGQALPDRRRPRRGGADRPVVLERVDGHAIVANSAAMRAAGVTAATPAPAGGRDRERPVRRQRDGSDRPGRFPPRRRRGRPGARQGAGNPARLRRHRRRLDEHVAGRLAGDPPRGRGGTAQRPADDLHAASSKLLKRSAAADAAGSTATACAWSASSSSPTARSARAAPG